MQHISWICTPVGCGTQFMKHIKFGTYSRMNTSESVLADGPKTKANPKEMIIKGKILLMIFCRCLSS